MQIGFTGHQERPGIRWSWVEQTLSAELRKLENVQKALTCLAAGSDQRFAEVAIELYIPVVAIVPLEGYERFFDEAALANYQRLLEKCQVIQLASDSDPERAFFEAGKFIVDRSDLLLAVWDGARAEGLGGTGDIVSYAKQKCKPVVHINPRIETVSRI